MSRFDKSRSGSPEQQLAAGLSVDWLHTELTYANSKHGVRNPQRSAIEGGLQPGGPAYQDLANYLRGQSPYAAFETGERALILKTSQALGKHASASRALVSVLLHDAMGIGSWELADKLSIDHLRRQSRSGYIDDFVTPITPDFDMRQFWEQENEPIIAQLAAGLEHNPEDPQLLYKGESLLLKNVGLFVGYSALTGMIARPGLPSGQVERWPRF